jgi:hypothetical protein
MCAFMQHITFETCKEALWLQQHVHDHQFDISRSIGKAGSFLIANKSNDWQGEPVTRVLQSE